MKNNTGEISLKGFGIIAVLAIGLVVVGDGFAKAEAPRAESLLVRTVAAQPARKAVKEVVPLPRRKPAQAIPEIRLTDIMIDEKALECPTTIKGCQKLGF